MGLFLPFSSQVTTNDAESFGQHIGGDVGVGYVGFGGSGDSSKYSSQSEYSSQVTLDNCVAIFSSNRNHMLLLPCSTRFAIAMTHKSSRNNCYLIQLSLRQM